MKPGDFLMIDVDKNARKCLAFTEEGRLEDDNQKFIAIIDGSGEGNGGKKEDMNDGSDKQKIRKRSKKRARFK
jgi:hypothetical protein